MVDWMEEPGWLHATGWRSPATGWADPDGSTTGRPPTWMTRRLVSAHQSPRAAPASYLLPFAHEDARLPSVRTPELLPTRETRGAPTPEQISVCFSEAVLQPGGPGGVVWAGWT